MMGPGGRLCTTHIVDLISQLAYTKKRRGKLDTKAFVGYNFEAYSVKRTLLNITESSEFFGSMASPVMCREWC